MEVFTDLAQFSTIFAIVGAILFVLGFLLKGNAKKDTAAGVISTILITLGVVGLLFAGAQWISQSITNWNFFSDRMI
jgi:membrane-bound ClpP family serine protease